MFNIFSGFSDSAAEMPFAKLPKGFLERDGQTVHASPDLVELAQDGWALKLKIESMLQDFKAINDKLQKALGVDVKLRVEGLCTVNISGRKKLTLIDADLCQQLLGGRFSDLIDERTEYNISDKLKEIVMDADHPLCESLRSCIEIKESVSTNYRPAAKAA